MPSLDQHTNRSIQKSNSSNPFQYTRRKSTKYILDKIHSHQNPQRSTTVLDGNEEPTARSYQSIRGVIQPRQSPRSTPTSPKPYCRRKTATSRPPEASGTPSPSPESIGKHTALVGETDLLKGRPPQSSFDRGRQPSSPEKTQIHQKTEAQLPTQTPLMLTGWHSSGRDFAQVVDDLRLSHGRVVICDARIALLHSPVDLKERHRNVKERHRRRQNPSENTQPAGNASGCSSNLKDQTTGTHEDDTNRTVVTVRVWIYNYNRHPSSSEEHISMKIEYGETRRSHREIHGRR